MVKLTAGNSTYPKGGVLCFKDRYVVNETLVLLINICGESTALRVAAKRYGQVQNNDTIKLKCR
jgi:hypothetical protein